MSIEVTADAIISILKVFGFVKPRRDMSLEDQARFLELALNAYREAGIPAAVVDAADFACGLYVEERWGELNAKEASRYMERNFPMCVDIRYPKPSGIPRYITNHNGADGRYSLREMLSRDELADGAVAFKRMLRTKEDGLQNGRQGIEYFPEEILEKFDIVFIDLKNSDDSYVRCHYFNEALFPAFYKTMTQAPARY